LRAELRGSDIVHYALVAADGKVLWRHKPDNHYYNWTVGKPEQLAAYQASPRMPLTAFGYPFRRVEVRNDYVLVIRAGLLIALARSDGHRVAEAQPAESGQTLPATHADITVETPAKTCVEHRATLHAVVECDDRVFWWNRNGLLAFRKGGWWEYLGRGSFADETRDYAFDLAGAKVRMHPVD
jgi:hypothetical protein